MEESSLDHVETMCDAFLSAFDFEQCSYSDVLYLIEESHLEELSSTVKNAKLPKKYHSYKDFFHEK